MSLPSVPHELTFQNAIGIFNALWNLGGDLVSDPKIGDFDDWLGVYRDGLRGMFARLIAVDRQYVALHNYQLHVTDNENPNWWAIECECCTGLILFGMDSMLECLVFALNAVGYAKSKTDFRNITDAKALKRICIIDVYDLPQAGAREVAGYRKFMPRFVKCWENWNPLIARIADYHSVSKHRSATATGGHYRQLYMRANPLLPGLKTSDTSFTVQTLTQDFQKFVDELLPIALEDVAAAFGRTVHKRNV